MKPSFVFTLFLLASLSGPAAADTAETLPKGCNLAGRPVDGDDACKEMRVAFRADVNTCMARLSVEAEARAGGNESLTSHSYRARYLLCDAEVRDSIAR